MITTCSGGRQRRSRPHSGVSWWRLSALRSSRSTSQPISRVITTEPPKTISGRSTFSIVRSSKLSEAQLAPWAS